MKGKLDSLFWDFREKCIKVQVSIFAERSLMEILEKLLNTQIRIDLKKWSEKRSLTANAYFHVLCGKIASVLEISDARAKNILIGKYGQLDFVDGEVCTIKSNISSEQMLEQEHLHCREVNGPDVNCHYYLVYRGSHTYDSKEFSRLLNGTVQDAKELGIETIPPDELKRMMERYGVKD